MTVVSSENMLIVRQITGGSSCRPTSGKMHVEFVDVESNDRGSTSRPLAAQRQRESNSPIATVKFEDSAATAANTEYRGSMLFFASADGWRWIRRGPFVCASESTLRTRDLDLAASFRSALIRNRFGAVRHVSQRRTARTMRTPKPIPIRSWATSSTCSRFAKSTTASTRPMTCTTSQPALEHEGS